MRARLSIFCLLLGCAISTGGCKAPQQKREIETFARAPVGWQQFAAGKYVPASLTVKNHQLAVSGPQAVFCPTAYVEPVAQVDVAFVDGDHRVLAGLALVHSSDPATYHVLAIRASGEWRVYRSADPTRARGGAGWQTPGREDKIAGFRRLSVAWSNGRGFLAIDGRRVAELPKSSALGSSAREAQAEGGSGWKVGLVVSDGAAAWNNFLVAERKDSFRASEFVNWGGTVVSKLRQKQFASEVDRFRRSPSRVGILRMRAALDGAVAAASDKANVEARGVALTKNLSSAAERIGESRLMSRAFQATRYGSETRDFAELAKKARDTGRTDRALVFSLAAAEVGGGALDAGAKKLLSSLDPLTYSFEFDDSRAEQKKVLTKGSAAAAVQQVYGALSTKISSDLEIFVDVDRGVLDKATEPKAIRRVPVVAEGAGLSATLSAELSRLEESFPEELEEAKTRAGLIRVGSQTLGPASRAVLVKKRIGPESLELHVDDAKRLEKVHARLTVLREKSRASKRATLREEKIPALRTTYSIGSEVSVTVLYQSQKIVEVSGFRAYSNLELWTHPAVPAKGIAASRPGDELRDAAKSVRVRVLRRIANAVSRESLLAKLPERERLPFLTRLAIATRSEEDTSSLKWHLQQSFKLSPELRDAVARRLLSGGRS